MIEVCGLTKRYGEVLAVDDLSFTVRPGEMTGFFGPNGAGKSTTMRMKDNGRMDRMGWLKWEYYRSWSVSRSESWVQSRSLRTSRTVLGVLVARVRSASGGTDRVRGPGRRGRAPSRPGDSGPAWTVRCPHPSLWWVRGGAVRRRRG
ncbi:ATP-binding cassette domain-containing protein [Streptomyces sp. P9-A2]|uniref:ATP-binding cassette domain-containing protein n=1 Tax=Streptomyces sp. P9-A2 TaxID=3072284 RepID=UPI002FC71453